MDQKNDLISEAYRTYYAIRRATPPNKPRRTWAIALLSFALFAADTYALFRVYLFAFDGQEAAFDFLALLACQIAAFSLGLEAAYRRCK